MRAIVVGTGVALAAGFIAACAANKSAPMTAAAPQSTDAAGAMPGDPHAEIDRLAKQIDDQLPMAGVEPMQTPTCAAQGTCTAMPMAVPPVAEDTTCHPSKSETCGEVCSLSTSICENAEKICTIAVQLGKADAYANEKCQSGNDSCSRSHARCCACT
ncbi:MAG TPA: hypothetical protein VGM39_05645 [Kofleriaceae bacterium]|jgi:hypothetical protein